MPTSILFAVVRSPGRLAWLLGASLVCLGCGRAPEIGPVANLSSAEKIRAALGGDAEAAGGEAEEATGTGWATLRGRFTYDGQAPAMPAYAGADAHADKATCAPGGTAPPQEYLKVDSSGGLANVVLFARDAKRVNDSAAPKTDAVLFDQKECFFRTHVFALSVGQTLDIKNSDPVGHNTNIGGQNAFNQTIPAGETVKFEVKKEESAPAPVRCSIHPWMLAYMLPRKNGYYAVTAADGSFEIANLPAGEDVEIQVWHEHSAGPNGALVVDVEAAKELKWSKKGRFKIRLEADETRTLEIAVPPSAFKGA
jgi:hypothetical protein